MYYLQINIHIIWKFSRETSTEKSYLTTEGGTRVSRQP